MKIDDETTYRGVWLEQVGMVFIPPSYQQWHPKRTHSTGGGKQSISIIKTLTEYSLSKTPKDAGYIGLCALLL